MIPGSARRVCSGRAEAHRAPGTPADLGAGSVRPSRSRRRGGGVTATLKDGWMPHPGAPHTSSRLAPALLRAASAPREAPGRRQRAERYRPPRPRRGGGREEAGGETSSSSAASRAAVVASIPERSARARHRPPLPGCGLRPGGRPPASPMPPACPRWR